MASVNKDSKGWRIMFVDPNGDRRQIRPGKGTHKATAQKISRHMEELIAYWDFEADELDKASAGTVHDRVLSQFEANQLATSTS